MRKLFHLSRRAARHAFRFLTSPGFIVFLGISFLILVFLFGGRNLIRSWTRAFFAERGFQNLERLAPSVATRENGENLLASSFSDLFSGTGWIDSEKTNLYRDNRAEAVLWEPAFSWNLSGAKTESLTSKECIGNRCAEISGGNLVLYGARVVLPRALEYDSRKLALHAMRDAWLVGGVVEEKGEWKGYLYSFDGREFTPLCGGAVFTSQYEASPGLGGDDARALFLYGAYEGKAIEVWQNRCEDVSRLFGIRLMDEGFDPVIIRPEGTDWFVFSRNGSKRVFIKAFPDSATGAIAGTIDLGAYLRREGMNGIAFRGVRGQDGALAVSLLVEDGKEESGFWIDRGFSAANRGTIASRNLNTYPGSLTRRATIVSADLYPGSTSPELYLSNNGRDWTPARIGEEVVFKDKNGKELYWKADFPKGSGDVSPYLKRIRVDFKVLQNP